MLIALFCFKYTPGAILYNIGQCPGQIEVGLATFLVAVLSFNLVTAFHDFYVICSICMNKKNSRNKNLAICQCLVPFLSSSQIIFS